MAQGHDHSARRVLGCLCAIVGRVYGNRPERTLHFGIAFRGNKRDELE